MTWIEIKEGLINLDHVIAITPGNTTIVIECGEGSFHVFCKDVKAFQKAFNALRTAIGFDVLSPFHSWDLMEFEK